MDTPEVDRLLASVRLGGGRKSLATLIGLGEAALPAIRAGLRDGDWRMRRDCLRFLDHQVDPESGRLVLECLDDDHPEVRKWAAHALGCDRCKAGGRGGFDSVPALLRVAREDPSLRVRRSAVLALAWSQPCDRRIAACLRNVLESERDPRTRMHAADGLARHREGSGPPEKRPQRSAASGGSPRRGGAGA